MPTLEFKGKQFVHSHHLSVPFRQLEVDKSKSLSDKPDLDGNLIIHGDNLHALKALLPQYAGKVKCIYIDPPYNTGNEGWCYNDKVNSPLIREWLKKSANPVDKEDLERHDKWLCLMLPRLKLLQELLSEQGVIFCSIDENEHQHLRMLMDDIFDEENFIAEFIWNSSGHSDNQYDVKINHEYILCYAKNNELCSLGHVVDPNTREESNLWKGFAENSITKNGPKNPPSTVELPVGFPCHADELSLDKHEIDVSFYSEIKKHGYISRENTKKHSVSYPIRKDNMLVSKGRLIKPCNVYAGWANLNKLKEFISSGCKPISDSSGDKVTFYLSKKGVIYYKKERSKARNILSVLSNMGTTEKMRADLETVGIKFQYPKPVELVSYLIQISGAGDGDVILDSFAGSGTTAHATLALNNKDDKKRKFILVECEEYAHEKTAERVRLAIAGASSPKNEFLQQGLGGAFTFCTLGEEMNVEGLLKADKMPDYEALARYVFYTATGKVLDKVAKASGDYFIGETDLYRVHLIYKPEQEFMRNNESALNAEMVERIADSNTSGKKCLVFASAKFMGQKELNSKKIDFCQLPYAIHRVLGD